MADDRPQNFWQVLTGAAGAGLETLGRSKAEEKQRALPEALSIFSTILQAERAQEARALTKIQRKEAAINVDIKGLQLQKMLELQKLGFDNPVELEEAMLRIRGEVDLEKTKSLMDMVEEETGVTTIPSGLKPFEEPRGPEELGVDAALKEAAKRGKLEELGIFPSTKSRKLPNVVKQIRDTYNKELKTWNAERRAWEKEQEPSMMEKLTDKETGEITEKEEYPVPKPTLAEIYETYYRDYIIAQGLDSDSVETALDIGGNGQDLIGPPTPEAYDLKAIEAWAEKEIEGWDKLDSLTKQQVREQRRQELLGH